jgi:hypothetical protein
MGQSVGDLPRVGDVAHGADGSLQIGSGHRGQLHRPPVTGARRDPTGGHPAAGPSQGLAQCSPVVVADQLQEILAEGGDPPEDGIGVRSDEGQPVRPVGHQDDVAACGQHALGQGIGEDRFPGCMLSLICAIRTDHMFVFVSPGTSP